MTIQVLRQQRGGWVGSENGTFTDLQYYLCWRRWVGLEKPKTCWRNTWTVPSSHANSTSKRHAAIQFKCHEKEQNWPKYAFPFKPYIIKLICLSLKSAVGNQESMYTIYLYSAKNNLFKSINDKPMIFVIRKPSFKENGWSKFLGGKFI